MKKKELYKIINEEVSDFDFLGMKDIDNEHTHDKTLNSKEFQTNLINDIVNNIDDNSKFTNFSATYVHNNTNMHNDDEIIELEIELEYVFEGKEYNLILFLSGVNDDDNMDFSTFNIKIFSKAGDQIKIDWVEKKSELYEVFIETLVSPFIE